MLEELQRKLEKVTERKQALSCVQDAAESKLHMELRLEDGSVRGELWIRDGQKIISSIARPSGNEGYLGLLEILALAQCQFKVDSATPEPKGESIDINVGEVIADEQKVVDSIKSIIWPLAEVSELEEEDDLKKQKLEILSLAAEITDPESFYEKTGDLDDEDHQAAKRLSDLQTALPDAEDAAAFHEEKKLLPDEDDQQAIRLQELERARPASAAPEEFHKEVGALKQADDQNAKHIEELEKARPESEPAEAFYNADDAIPKQDDQKDLRVAEYDRLKQRSEDPAEFYVQASPELKRTDSAALAASERGEMLDFSPGAADTDAAPEPEISTAAERETAEGLASFARGSTPKRPEADPLKAAPGAAYAVFKGKVDSWHLPRGTVLIFANLLVALLLISWLAVEKSVQSARIVEQDSKGLSAHIDTLTDDESLAQQPKDTFRQPAPPPAPAPQGLGVHNAGDGMHGGLDDNFLGLTFSQPAESAPQLTERELAQVDKAIQDGQARSNSGDQKGALAIYMIALQRFKFDARLRLAAIDACMALKDYKQAAILCKDGLRLAQNAMEFDIFMAKLKNIPGAVGTKVQPIAPRTDQ
jgi:hypothetical protein